jgi:hypothetical protein
VDGAIVGFWRRRISGRTTRVELVPYRPLTPTQRRDVDAARRRFMAFCHESA